VTSHLLPQYLYPLPVLVAVPHYDVINLVVEPQQVELGQPALVQVQRVSALESDIGFSVLINIRSWSEASAFPVQQQNSALPYSEKHSMGVAALVGVVRARSQLVALLVLLPAAVRLAAHEQPAHQAQRGVGGRLVGGKARAFVIHRLRHRLSVIMI